MSARQHRGTQGHRDASPPTCHSVRSHRLGVGGLGWALPPPPARPGPVSAAAAFPSHWPLCLHLGICLSVSAARSCLRPRVGGEGTGRTWHPQPLAALCPAVPQPPGALQGEPCRDRGGVSGTPRGAGWECSWLWGAQDNAHRARGVPTGGTSRCGDTPVCAPGLWGTRTHSGGAEGYTQGVVNPGRHSVTGEGLQGHGGLGVIPGSPGQEQGDPPNSPKAFLGWTRRRVKG